MRPHVLLVFKKNKELAHTKVKQIHPFYLYRGGEPGGGQQLANKQFLRKHVGTNLH